MRVSVPGFNDFSTLYAADPYFAKILTQAQRGDTTKFTLSDGFLFSGTKLCIPSCNLRLRLITKLHGVRHAGRDRTIGLLQEHFFRPSLWRDMAHFVERCHTCQVLKGSATNAGLYRPLLVLEGPWLDVSIDFVLDLPRTQCSFDLIFVVVDRFSKMVNFIPCKRTTDALHVAQLYFRDVYRLHGLPTSIIYNRDTRFLSHFWRTLWHFANTEFHFSSAYHSQTDGQTEVVNRSLRNILRYLVGVNLKTWDM